MMQFIRKIRFFLLFMFNNSKVVSAFAGFLIAVLIGSTKAVADSQHLFAGNLPLGVVNWISAPTFLPKEIASNSQYTSLYLSPAAHNWNLVSSNVLLTLVQSGGYQARVTNNLDAASLSKEYGHIVPYCNIKGVIQSGLANCQSLIWSSVVIVGQELPMGVDKFTTTNKIALYTHEWGHALSLQHTDSLPASTLSIMKSGSYQNSWKNLGGPQSADKEHLRLKWGN
jgi:hypothetical protein